MPLTLLEIVQRVQGELGFPQSTTVVGNVDPTTTQLFALANRCIDELRRMNRWTVCQFEYNIVVNTPLITTGTLTTNSPIITGIPSTVGLFPTYWQVGADGVPQAARIQTVDSATQVTMDMESTGDATDTQVTFAQDTYPMPPDFDFFNNQTMWDRTNRWQLLGPDSPQQDQFQRSGVVATGPRRHFRQLGNLQNRFRIWPAPVEISSPLQLVFEYLSLNSVAANGRGAIGITVTAGGAGYEIEDTITLAGGAYVNQIVLTVIGVTAGAVTAVQISDPGIYTTRPSNPVAQGSSSGSGSGATFTVIWGQAFAQYFTADNDVPILDDNAIIMGMKAAFWEIKGFNFANMRNNWIDYVEQLVARDGAAPNLSLAKSPMNLLISSWQVPDGNWPGTSS